MKHFADGTPVPMTAVINGKLLKDLTREKLEAALLKLLAEHEELQREQREASRDLFRNGLGERR